MKILAIALFASSGWHYNESSNEMVYWVQSKHDPNHTCAFISVNHMPSPGIAAGEGFIVDVVRPDIEEFIGSKWFSEVNGAEKYIQKACKVRK